jgi:osmotically-inducible protein OsmY
MKLKRNKKKPIDKALPLVAVGVAVAVLGAIAVLLGSRTRRQKAKGAVQEATTPVRHSGREYDDVTLARKVESEVLGDADVPKGDVVVSAQNGVVELRGEVKRPEDLKDLGAAAAKVAGVQGVNNLLHTPGSEPKHSPVSDPADVRDRAEQN